MKLTMTIATILFFAAVLHSNGQIHFEIEEETYTPSPPPTECVIEIRKFTFTFNLKGTSRVFPVGEEWTGRFDLAGYEVSESNLFTIAREIKTRIEKGKNEGDFTYGIGFATFNIRYAAGQIFLVYSREKFQPGIGGGWKSFEETNRIGIYRTNDVFDVLPNTTPDIPDTVPGTHGVQNASHPTFCGISFPPHKIWMIAITLSIWLMLMFIAWRTS